jgi:hypothetical protein
MKTEVGVRGFFSSFFLKRHLKRHQTSTPKTRWTRMDEDEIWDSVKTALTELIEQDLGKAGKGKQVVEGGVDQGSSGGGGEAVRSGVEHFGGGKRAKVGMVAIPECQDSSLLTKQVGIVSVDVCGF